MLYLYWSIDIIFYAFILYCISLFFQSVQHECAHQTKVQWHSPWVHDKQVANLLRWFQTWWAKTERRCQNKYRPIRIYLWGPPDFLENYKNSQRKCGWFLPNLVRRSTFSYRFGWMTCTTSKHILHSYTTSKNAVHTCPTYWSTMWASVFVWPFSDSAFACGDVRCILSWLSWMSASPEK